MALYTACIYSPREATMGVRISVMSRHKQDDGKTEDTRIRGLYDEWIKALAPSETDLGDFYVRHRLSREELLMRYRISLRTQVKKQSALLALACRAEAEDITILCKEERPKDCHRMVAAQEAKILVPELEVIIG